MPYLINRARSNSPRALLSSLYGLYVGLAIPWKRRRLGIAGGYPPPQDSVHWNRTLLDAGEVGESVTFLRAAHAFLHHDRPKNWDLARALRFVLAHSQRTAAVLDVGCGQWGGMLLPTLAVHGYEKLFGCDPLLRGRYRRGPISYLKCNFFESGFSRESFQFVVCLSVIEHGMPVHDYLREAQRILSPGGYLLTSTDYWNEPEGERGVVNSQGPHKDGRVFDREGTEQLLEAATTVGLRPYDPMDFRTGERVVTWAGRAYTYAFFVHRKM